jgi:hypothetical protein
MTKFKFEAPRPQADASRQRNIINIVPLDPAHSAGFAEHLPVKSVTNDKFQNYFSLQFSHLDFGFHLTLGF